ncbi:MAG TPA: hypothetical protein VGA22_13790, partial [Gemmatimonadales bacterium]
MTLVAQGLALALAAVLLWTPAHAQEIPEDTITVPGTALEYGFTNVTGIRELHDGRVIVVDAGVSMVYLIDASGTSVEQLGRAGDGPGEYRGPAKIFALPGDSSAILDGLRGRLMLLGPKAEFVRFLYSGGCAQCSVSSVGIVLIPPAVTDGRGYFYALAQPIVRTPAGELVPADSAAIERWRGGSATRDTVAFLDAVTNPALRVIAGTLFAPHPGRAAPIAAFRTSQQWAVSPDGRVAIVYPEPYHVDYVDSPGHVSIGPDIPYDRVEVSDDLKRQWLAERPTSAEAIVSGPTGVARVRRPVAPPANVSWPRYLPPFVYHVLTHPEPVRFAPDGRLWIERAVGAHDVPLVDVVDERGQLVRRIRLPAGRRLAGFGRTSVYLVRKDDVDLQYLE